MLVLLDTVANPTLISNNHGSDEVRSKEILESSALSLDITDEIIDLNNDKFITKLIQKMSEHRLMPESTPVETFKRTITQMISAIKLTANHVISRCKTPIIFVRAGLEPQPEDPSMFDWKQHTSNEVAIYNVETLHSSMWETEPSKEVAKIISNHLSAKHTD